MWAMGYVVEGANYYTNVLPCPLSNSCSLRDAAIAARGMLNHVSSKMGAAAENKAIKAVSINEVDVEGKPLVVTINGN
jgi:hypothetical protein